MPVLPLPESPPAYTRTLTWRGNPVIAFELTPRAVLTTFNATLSLSRALFSDILDSLPPEDRNAERMLISLVETLREGAQTTSTTYTFMMTDFSEALAQFETQAEVTLIGEAYTMGSFDLS